MQYRLMHAARDCPYLHPVTAIHQESLLFNMRMWNYSTSSAELFKHIVQQQHCLANHLVNWVCSVLEDRSLSNFTAERRGAWAEDLFVYGNEMVSPPSPLHRIGCV